MTKFIDNFLKNRAERKRIKKRTLEMKKEFDKIHYYMRRRLINVLHSNKHFLEWSLYDDWRHFTDLELKDMVVKLVSLDAKLAIIQQQHQEQILVREKYKEIVI